MKANVAMANAQQERDALAEAIQAAGVKAYMVSASDELSFKDLIELVGKLADGCIEDYDGINFFEREFHAKTQK